MTTGTVRLHRVLRTKPEKLYRAFLEPDAMAKWIPPFGFTCKVHHMDAKVGGTFKMSFHNFSTGHGHSFGGEYRELVPNELIRYTDKFDDPNLPGEMQVTVSLRVGVVRHRAEHRSRRNPGGHSARDVLPGLAGIADPACTAGRARDTRVASAARSAAHVLARRGGLATGEGQDAAPRRLMAIHGRFGRSITCVSAKPPLRWITGDAEP